nr:hypothetical protein Iba_chr13dCG4930 [Ipomoea batatas]
MIMDWVVDNATYAFSSRCNLTSIHELIHARGALRGLALEFDGTSSNVIDEDSSIPVILRLDGVFPIQELESCRLFVAPEKESREGKLGGGFVHDVREVGAHGGAGGEKWYSGNIERQGKLYKPWLHGIMDDQIRVQGFQDFGEIRCRHIQDFLEGVMKVAREAIGGLVVRRKMRGFWEMEFH